jgi:hypothetical protein
MPDRGGGPPVRAGGFRAPAARKSAGGIPWIDYFDLAGGVRRIKKRILRPWASSVARQHPPCLMRVFAIGFKNSLDLSVKRSIHAHFRE